VRYLWMIAAAMVLVGLFLLGSSVVLGSGAIGGIAGTLLVWSGVVKVIVLKIWQATLHAPAISEGNSEASCGRMASKRPA
jgi:membrane protein implicated in regulation of membrane protease activity